MHTCKCTQPYTSLCQRFQSLYTAVSDMCQSDLFTLVNCLKALLLDAVHPSWQQETMIR